MGAAQHLASAASHNCTRPCLANALIAAESFGKVSPVHKLLEHMWLWLAPTSSCIDLTMLATCTMGCLVVKGELVA